VHPRRYARVVPGALSRKLRTRLVWGLMRTLDHEHRRRLHERRWMRPLEALLARGELQVLGGPVCRARISARHLPHWGAQAWNVLTGTHEPMVHEALRRTLGPGDVFVDVGSNIGYTAMVGASLVGREGRVVALDAQRECAEATRLHAQLNDLCQLEAVHAAAAAQSGEADVVVTQDALWSRLASVGDHPLAVRRDRVPAIAVDDLPERFGLARIDVVKIDVEGGELDVIAGMRRTLTDHRPVVVCEMHGRNAEFCDAVESFSYRVVNLDGREPVAQADPNVHVLCEPLAVA
jgi:FkbM family methyltransferase